MNLGVVSPAELVLRMRNTNNLRHVDDTTLLAEDEEERKSLLMRVKEESERGGLKLNIKKTKIMASSPINSWQIDGEKVEIVTDFLFLGSKITMDGDCSHEIRRHLFLGRKGMTNLDSVLESRDITLPTKVHMVKAMVFPVVMYSCKGWTINKAESQRIDAFELWCWRRLLRVPWTPGRSNLSILREVNPEYSLEGLMLKLKRQYFGHLMRTADSLEKFPMLWKIEGRRRRGWDGWMASSTQCTWTWANFRRWWETGRPGAPQSMWSQRVGHDWVAEQQQQQWDIGRQGNTLWAIMRKQTAESRVSHRTTSLDLTSQRHATGPRRGEGGPGGRSLQWRWPKRLSHPTQRVKLVWILNRTDQHQEASFETTGGNWSWIGC